MSEKRVYIAEEIMEMLSLGRSKTYQLLEEAYRKQEPFRVIRVGRSVRVDKASFDKWLGME